MMENYEHYITKNIRAFYKKRLGAPLMYLLLLAVLWFVFPLQDMLMPASLNQNRNIEDAYKDNQRYISVDFTDLTFTGYTSNRFGSTNGYFYYGVNDNGCFIVLLSPSTCEEGNPNIDKLTVTCRIMKSNRTYAVLLANLAEDLQWTPEGIQNQLSAYYYSEPDFNMATTVFLFALYFGSLLYAVILLALYIIYIFFPFLAPACQNLIVFGNPKEQLEEAEEELATLPQLATEDMFITEHYFIQTSPYGNAIVPIQEILWIYKYSTMHRFLWYHMSISYTLHITANKHLFIQCPKNMKSDIDGIIDYLAEANHDILVGFDEKNRLKVQALQGKPFRLEKLAAFLRKKL